MLGKLFFYIYITDIDKLAIYALIVFLAWTALMAILSRREKARRTICAVLCAVVVFAIFWRTLFNRSMNVRVLEIIPFSFIFRSINHIEIARSFFMNVLLFMPFGATLPFVLRGERKRRVKVTVLSAFAASVIIEVTQFAFSLGYAETDDVIANTLGTGIGSATYILAELLCSERAAKFGKKVGRKIVRSPLAPIFSLLWRAASAVVYAAMSARWFIKGYRKPKKPQILSRDATFIYKSFERKRMAKRLFRKIKKYYPDARVIIADDSRVPLEIDGAEIVHLPFNSGLSRGLNAALERVRTPYVIRMDDDELLTPLTRWDAQLALLRRHPEIDLCAVQACSVIGFEPPRRIARKYRQFPMMHARLKIPHVTKIDAHRYVMGKVPNVFIARTDSLRKIGYDDNIRMIDHHEFFLRAAGNIACAMDIDSFVLHSHDPFDRNYERFRNDYYTDVAYIRKKHAVDRTPVRK